MTVDKSADFTSLVLKELDVPGRTGPVSQAPVVWGLNIAAVQDNFPKQGLLCRAGPWGVMGQGDKLLIKLGGQTVFTETVDAHEVNTTLSMFVPAARFSDGLFTLDYAVTRQGGTPEPSEVMQVRVKLTRPGGHDSDEGPGHSALKMTIPREILDGGINKDNIEDGVPITIGPCADGPKPYPNAAAGDVIQVTWGGVFVLYGPLTQDQADGKVPLIVHIREQTIREAGDSGDAGLAVAFEVYDLVDNRSADWSHEQRVVVAVHADRLDAPLCKEALNNVLDADKLGDADGTAQILAVDTSKFKVGDTPFVRLKGTPKEGMTIDLEIEGKPLVSVPGIPEIAIPNAALRQLAKTQISLSFRLKKADGSADLLSRTQFITVIGEIKRLLAPVALDAAQGALDPELAQARIEIPFDKSFAAGQAIKLFWLGTRPDLSTYLPDLPLRPITQGDITAEKPLLINVPNLHLKQIEGGTLELYYQLLSDDAVLGTMNRVNATHAIRESIHAEILNVGEPKKELPEPSVDGVVDGALPADTAGTQVTVEYLNTVKDDEVFCLWLGSKTGRHEDSLKLSSFTAGKPVPFPIPAELIKGNEGGTVEASYSIKWADGRPTSYSDELAFRVGAALEAPVISEVEDFSGWSIPDNGHSVHNRVTVKGTAPAGQEVEIFVGNDSRGKVTALFDNSWSKALDSLALYTLLSIKAVGQYASNPPSNIWRLTVMNVINPSIDSVKETRTGKVIAADGVTVETSLTLEGDANSHLRVQLSDNGIAINGATPTADASNKWSHPLTGLSVGSHGFKAKALYGSGTESAIKNLTVATARQPTIQTVADSKGGAITNGGTTVDPNLTLTGEATALHEIEIFINGVTTGGKATANASGIWTRTVGPVALGKNDMTVKALYGVGVPDSVVWVVNVAEAAAPTITSVKGSPSGVEIHDGTTTVETAATLTGTAAKGQKVDVLDGTVSKGQATADLNTGIWTLPVSGLAVGEHSFTAKAMYGSPPPVSAARTFTVLPLLVFDGTPLTLSGATIISRQWAATGNFPSGATSVRSAAEGGTPPYHYSSSDTGVASVEVIATGCRITSQGNGVARITVSDARNQSISFEVTVSNVKYLTVSTTPMNNSQAVLWRQNAGGQIIEYSELAVLTSRHSRPGREQVWIWMCNPDEVFESSPDYRATAYANPGSPTFIGYVQSNHKDAMLLAMYVKNTP